MNFVEAESDELQRRMEDGDRPKLDRREPTVMDMGSYHESDSRIDMEEIASDDAATKKRLRTVLGQGIRMKGKDQHLGEYYWEMSFRGILPGIHPCGVPSALDALQDGRPSRKLILSIHGTPLHFWSLEFERDELECAYQVDAARRHIDWVKGTLVVWGCFNFGEFLYRTVRRVTPMFPDSDAMATLAFVVPGIYTLFDVLQLIQLRVDRNFVVQHFERVLAFWTVLQAGVAAFYVLFMHHMLRADGRCVIGSEGLSSMPLTEWATVRSFGRAAEVQIYHSIFLVLMIYRLRFIYYVYYSLVLMSLYSLQFWQFSEVCLPNYVEMTMLLGGNVCAIIVSYLYEFISRRDFVFASAVLEESSRTTALLSNVLPEPIVAQMLKGSEYIVSQYPSVSILFADIVSFTTMSSKLSPIQLVTLLDDLFLRFDSLAEDNNLEKIKTIGDCYMAAGGVPNKNTTHPADIARMGLGMIDALDSGAIKNPATGEPLLVRVGIHTGPAVAGIIGDIKFSYDLWGDAVNTASRMESHGEKMKVHCSEAMFRALRDKFVLHDRGTMTVKGKGELHTYFVVKEKEAATPEVLFIAESEEEEDVTAAGSMKHWARQVTSFGAAKSRASTKRNSQVGTPRLSVGSRAAPKRISLGTRGSPRARESLRISEVEVSRTSVKRSTVGAAPLMTES